MASRAALTRVLSKYYLVMAITWWRRDKARDWFQKLPSVKMNPVLLRFSHSFIHTHTHTVLVYFAWLNKHFCSKPFSFSKQNVLQYNLSLKYTSM